MSKKSSAEEARERILSSESTLHDEDNLENSGRRTTVKAPKQKRSNLIPLLGILFVFGLLALALFLPPISLIQRLSGESTTASVPNVPTTNLSATTSLSDGTALALADGSANVNLSAVGQDAIVANTSGIWGNAAAVLPNNATPLGNFYELAYSGNAPLALSLFQFLAMRLQSTFMVGMGQAGSLCQVQLGMGCCNRPLLRSHVA